MNTSVWMAALVMGWVGSPHCLAMCGPLCATQSRPLTQWAFQSGRLVGYALAGALAGWSMQVVGDWSVQVQSVRPVWSFLHAMSFLLGLVMLVRGDQPGWLVGLAARLWRWVQQRLHLLAHLSGWPQAWLMGVLWVVWPCGLLYSALTLSALSGSALQGAITMSAFAVGSGVVLAGVPWLWKQLQSWRQSPAARVWRHAGIRLAGAMLAGASAWALWQGLVMDQAPWCVTT